MNVERLDCLSQDKVRRLFDYSAATGVLRWKVRRNQHAEAGAVAGCVQTHSETKRYKYLRVTIDGRLYLASRVIWLWMTGSFPENDIDHKDQNPLNNAWSNLRDTKENQKNCRRRRDNASGVTGVSWNSRSERWRARINIGGKDVFLGSFKIKEFAIAARKRASNENGYSPIHGAG